MKEGHQVTSRWHFFSSIFKLNFFALKAISASIFSINLYMIVSVPFVISAYKQNL